jgi:SAM-dependent methyltransferase
MSSQRVLYRIEKLPVFQNRMYDSPAEARACPKGDVELVEDGESGLVYNHLFRPELVTYDVHYQNEQAVSPLFVRHLDSVAAIVGESLGRERIVEIGCGKGRFLEMLLASGFDVRGFDPSYEGNNPRVTKSYFRADSGIRAEGLVLRHVLEHIQDPVDFLFKLKDANGGGGSIYIEVPCFDWICAHRTWFDIFYEHVNYFRLSDFHRMFGAVRESGRIFGDQYLYVVAELQSLHRPSLDRRDQIAFPSDFTRALKHRALQESAIWGGASKGVLFALLMERAGSPVELVIDINSAKQGKYLPATGLKVLGPADALQRLPHGATIYVMNSNYLDEIRQMSENRFNYIGVDNE